MYTPERQKSISFFPFQQRAEWNEDKNFALKNNNNNRLFYLFVWNCLFSREYLCNFFSEEFLDYKNCPINFFLKLLFSNYKLSILPPPSPPLCNIFRKVFLHVFGNVFRYSRIFFREYVARAVCSAGGLKKDWLSWLTRRPVSAFLCFYHSANLTKKGLPLHFYTGFPYVLLAMITGICDDAPCSKKERNKWAWLYNILWKRKRKKRAFASAIESPS